MAKIQPPNGSIEICEPTTEMIKRLQNILPYGMILLEEPFEGAKYGIVMQCGEIELNCLRFQPLEQKYDEAVELFDIHHYLIMHSYCQYINKGFLGAYLASPCMTEREDGLWESVVANFIFPAKELFEDKMTLWQKTLGKRQTQSNQFLDDQFGKGAAKMYNGFMESFSERHISLKVDKLFGKYISVGIRPKSYLGKLAMWFMVLDSQIICLRADLREQEDSAWEFLAKQGINKVYHLPSAPVTIDESDLDEAKNL